MSQSKRALIMAGGTGGHIFPGLALADELSSQGWEILWLGTAERMEAQLVPNHGYPIKFIDIKGVRNKGLLRKLLTPFMVIHAVWQGIQLIRQFDPNVVVGFGGYAALPGGIAAKLLAKKLVIHEQNAAAGLTNKVLSKIANKVLVAFKGTKGLKANAIVGNPVRSSIQSTKPKSMGPTLNVLVVGGSLGARVLNEKVPEAVSIFAGQGNRIRVLHQAGKDEAGKVEQNYHAATKQGADISVTDFIADMASAYQEADVVICRSGALTVSELALAGVPSILVPLPHAVDDHQTRNAEVLVHAGAGILLPQNELEQGELVKQLTLLAELPEQLNEMAKACADVAVKDATSQVANIVVNTASC
ncbi:undecaprenyldiphospho-muramoylpentapeptide beta-N-acetylglucosaminyltransferase [Catenovulum sp. SM1970]|uniref:undecaprenyldiphospho-muramoylpentapeptide beta-N-acetylglucosaminyltransferase n=1 Tax=Marinifaba aquimaris TaxID=2741323 RepID=UPI001573DFF9|nr:undecaprenyldiphospho-muramoylpentapeptide beta-N-acetylglucosaminyltransferase [Marinifaba aquimaris]NTS76587.1 undecaprenyldiphospho-muramoylpentapeptide beta-N-acetylglucosaminyltransferase [Marinifaba aquimaris]